MRKGRQVEAVVLPLAVAVAVVAAWDLAVRLSGTRVFPSPTAVLYGLYELARRGVLVRYLVDSLARVAAGYGAAVVLGVPLGLWTGMSERAHAFLGPLVQLLRPISPIAWIPMAILLFGVGRMAPIFLVFLGAFFPIVTAAREAGRTVPRMYVAFGRNLGLPRTALVMRIVLPAALPQIVTGLRIARVSPGWWWWRRR
jgi:NitT/TauT family transport system permease protein